MARDDSRVAWLRLALGLALTPSAAWSANAVLSGRAVGSGLGSALSFGGAALLPILGLALAATCQALPVVASCVAAASAATLIALASLHANPSTTLLLVDSALVALAWALGTSIGRRVQLARLLTAGMRRGGLRGSSERALAGGAESCHRDQRPSPLRARHVVPGAGYAGCVSCARRGGFAIRGARFRRRARSGFALLAHGISVHIGHGALANWPPPLRALRSPRYCRSPRACWSGCPQRASFDRAIEEQRAGR